MNNQNLVESEWVDSGVVVKDYIYSREEYTFESHLAYAWEFEK